MHAGRGQAELGEGLLDVAAAQHVHAGPGRIPAQPSRLARSSAAYSALPPSGTNVAGHASARLPRRAYSYGTRLANRQTSIAGAQPGDLIGGLLLVPVGGRDQPPGRDRLSARAAGPRRAPDFPAAARAGQHDPLHQVVRADDADRELALGPA